MTDNYFTTPADGFYKSGDKMIHAMELNDILELMAADIESDDAFFRVDSFWTRNAPETDDKSLPKAVYIGPFSLYDSV